MRQEGNADTAFGRRYSFDVISDSFGFQSDITRSVGLTDRLFSQKHGMYAQKASCKSRARQRRIRARTEGGFHLTLFYAMQGTSTRDVPA